MTLFLDFLYFEFSILLHIIYTKLAVKLYKILNNQVHFELGFSINAHSKKIFSFFNKPFVKKLFQIRA